MSYVKKNKINDYIFKLPNCKKLGSKRYKKAYMELAGYAGYSNERVKNENIRFYTGRHFWKTTMSKEKLGFDTEEFFMGHKINEKVFETYTHRGKQGDDLLTEKAGKVFEVLDKYLF